MIRRDFLATFFVSQLISAFGKGTNKPNLTTNNTHIFTAKEILGLIEPQLCGDYFCLRNEPMEAFSEMKYEAAKSGIQLWCTSAYRDFNYQRNIWNAKYRKLVKSGFKPAKALEEIMKYTSLPGTSRHHWGTDIDLVDALSYEIENPLDEHNFKPEGEYQYLKYWLNAHAGQFGYEEVYTNAADRTGFKYEPWHYSYAPISKTILQQLLEIDFSTVLELNQCKGFELMDNSFFGRYRKEYVLGINTALK